jgi:dipeptidyl-peptidase-4
MRSSTLPSPLLLCLLGSLALVVHAQDRLKSMPGYERHERMAKELGSAAKLGSVSVAWQDDGRTFTFQREGKRLRFDIATLTVTNAPASDPPPRERPGRRRRDPGAEHPARGRQFTSATSPDGHWRAFYRDANVWLSETNNTNALAITRDGSEARRIRYGTANWVYGEELNQTTALWWSSNNLQLAFYRFDETQLRDYYVTLDETQFQNRLLVEPYMKVGTPNPVVDLLVYDLASQRTVTLDVRSGQPFTDTVLGHYVYGVSWTADGREVLFHRTNRRQNVVELCAADPQSGRIRVVLREEWLPSWTENLPPIRWLADGRRFLVISERTGWRNLYLYHLDDGLRASLTTHDCDIETIERIDEKAGLVFYTAHSGDNPLKLQLHSVGLDGQGQRRLTDPAFHHTIDIAPDSQHFIDIAQTHNIPPTTILRDADGRCLAELGRSDLSRYRTLGLRTAELLRFKAADGQTDLYGLLRFPSNFNPRHKYPLLVSVYAGPQTVGAQETFATPSSLAEYGFLVASFDSRSASGRGKRFLDAIYCKLGIVEVDDQAAGVKSLWSRPYVDRRRVGMFGTSYGGTVSATSLLRYPDVFHAACANSAVTDYRNYDTIYAERYMRTPQENAAGFDAARVMSYATNLHGRLMIFYGTADDNVHPANALQLIQALQRAGKHFEVQVGPDQGHTAVNTERMMEFFIENLVLRQPDPWPPQASPLSPATPTRKTGPKTAFIPAPGHAPTRTSCPPFDSMPRRMVDP